MSHKRTLIRHALELLLKGTSPTYATEAGANVFSNRETNIPTSKLPAINIVYGEEVATPRDVRSATYVRKLPVNIEVKVESNSSCDDDADDLCKEIEDLINGDRSITGTASGTILLGTRFEKDASSEKPIMVATLNYEINYLTP